MSVAQMVGEVEREKLDWLNIHDSEGNVWRYEKRGEAAPDAVVHVEGRYLGGGVLKAELAKDKDKIPLLWQKESGLPKKVVVNYISGVSDRGAVGSWWEGKVEYEQVGHDEKAELLGEVEEARLDEHQKERRKRVADLESKGAVWNNEGRIWALGDCNYDEDGNPI
jgi:hypothetical protein